MQPWLGLQGRGLDAGELERSLTLRDGDLFEINCVDDRGRPQGRGLLVCTSRCRRDVRGTLVRALGCAYSDEYYAWWAGSTFGPCGDPLAKEILVHFCPARGLARCCNDHPGAEAIHVTSFRAVEVEELAEMDWVTPEQRVALQEVLLQVREPPRVPAEAGAAGAGGGPGGQAPADGGGRAPPGLPRGLEGIAEALGLPVAFPPPAPLGAAAPGALTAPAAHPFQAGPPVMPPRLDGQLARPPRADQGVAVVEEALSLGARVARLAAEVAEMQARRSKDRGVRTPGLPAASSHEDPGVAQPAARSRIMELAQHQPGTLAPLGLLRMGMYLPGRARFGLGETSAQVPLDPVVQLYLTTVLFPARGESAFGMRTSRELRTLGLVMDLLLEGQLASALDVLIQRIKALELAAEQGTWQQARWLELLPPSDVATWSREELREAVREQDMEIRLGLAGGRRERGRPHSPEHWRRQRDGERGRRDDPPPDRRRDNRRRDFPRRGGAGRGRGRRERSPDGGNQEQGEKDRRKL